MTNLHARGSTQLPVWRRLGTIPRVLGCIACTGLFLQLKAPAADITEALRSVVLIETDEALGSGFTIPLAVNCVVTNFHVVEGAETVQVRLQDGTAIKCDGYVVAAPDLDIAVLSLERPPGVPCLPMANQPPPPGSDVFAIGAPRGLAGSVTKGVLSAERKWSDLEQFFGEGFKTFGYQPDSAWLQTDAAITKGNSGGPLISEKGEVIGLNTLAAPATIAQNINFAVSVGHLKSLMVDARIANRALTPKPFSELPSKDASDEMDGAGRPDATTRYWNATARILFEFLMEHDKAMNGKTTVTLPEIPDQHPDGERYTREQYRRGERFVAGFAFQGQASAAELLATDEWRWVLGSKENRNDGALMRIKKDLKRRTDEKDRRDRVARRNMYGPTSMMQLAMAESAAEGRKKAAEKILNAGKAHAVAAEKLSKLSLDGVAKPIAKYGLELIARLNSVSVAYVGWGCSLRDGKTKEAVDAAADIALAHNAALKKFLAVDGNELRLLLQATMGINLLRFPDVKQ